MGATLSNQLCWEEINIFKNDLSPLSVFAHCYLPSHVPNPTWSAHFCWLSGRFRMVRNPANHIVWSWPRCHDIWQAANVLIWQVTGAKLSFVVFLGVSVVAGTSSRGFQGRLEIGTSIYDCGWAVRLGQGWSDLKHRCAPTNYSNQNALSFHPSVSIILEALNWSLTSCVWFLWFPCWKRVRRTYCWAPCPQTDTKVADRDPICGAFSGRTKLNSRKTIPKTYVFPASTSKMFLFETAIVGATFDSKGVAHFSP